MNSAQQLLDASSLALLDADNTKAIELTTSLLAQEPGHVKALEMRAKAYLHTGELSAAAADLLSALATDPDNAVLCSDLGVVMLHAGKFDEAVRYMSKAVMLEPANAYRYASRAYAQDAAGRIHEAIEDYKFALALDPDDIVSENNLGILEEKLGYTESANMRYDRIKDMSLPNGMPLPAITEPEPGGPPPRMTLSLLWQTFHKLASSGAERSRLLRFMKKGFRG